MPVADRFFPSAGNINRLQREGDFDELFLVGHVLSIHSDHLPPGHRQNLGRQPFDHRAGVQQ
jgi:hypothetical protein